MENRKSDVDNQGIPLLELESKGDSKILNLENESPLKWTFGEPSTHLQKENADQGFH
jgi:hypothetical protein